MAASGELISVLIIAGSDSSGGAGVQRDLQVLAERGVRGRCAITAVTAQTDERVAAVHLIPAEVIVRQIECALQAGVQAVKIGMLGTAEIVHAVARALAEVSLPIVIDPVLLSSSGHPLLDPAGREALRTLLAPRAALLTPNLPEAQCLLQASHDRQASDGGAEASARALTVMTRCPVLLKGGHGTGPLATDWLCTGEALTKLQGPRLALQMRGTGCMLATAIAIELSRGSALSDACRRAKDYVADKLRAT